MHAKPIQRKSFVIHVLNIIDGSEKADNQLIFHHLETKLITLDSWFIVLFAGSGFLVS